MENEQLWNSVLVEIELAVSKANFNTWFKDTKIIKQDGGVVFISVPNTFAKDWLFNKYHKTILRSLRNLVENTRSVEYVITKEDVKNKEAETSRDMVLGSTAELPLQDFYIDRENNLNPKYTFESFVVGPFNELAHAAAQAVVKKPGIAYNPFFVYGNTGHGKTHLIQAIGNCIKNQDIGKKIFYVTSEKFALDYINSVQANKANLFKEKYRKYDILIMDDIQFFSNKEKTQEELFHLFNSLYDNNKQIVFSSDKHPNFIPNLEDRLKSRFAAGMIVDIPTPDHESRLAILKTKARTSSVSITNDVLEHLAISVDGNIRELEGMLNVIICQSQLKGRELSINDVKNLIKNSAKPKKVVSVKDITKVVASFFNIEEADIYEKTRRKEVVKPRQLVMYILREDFRVSYPLIGQKLGGRDHTTVIHSCEKIKNELKLNTMLGHEIDQIRTML
ncbi:MAG: Chromosomal replication initiator protein DnaA [Parcubacteria group bacterium GW2011_GWA2_44_15]|nr:MAG: Chromosomal replication initiator protein DnaA [Parcubacteria group bacterium GW2011_GWA2_44_15]